MDERVSCREFARAAEPAGRVLQAAVALAAVLSIRAAAQDNVLTPQQRREGWVLLFDGELRGWATESGRPSRAPVEEGALNPHGSGGYMLVHEKPWGDFTLALEFKISPGCNSGIFVRTNPLTPKPGKDVGHNGIEIAIDDTQGAGFHDTGAIYDLVKPASNAMKPAGEWNHIEITCDKNRISVVLNGRAVAEMDLDEWTEENRRPDGSPHKFDVAYKDHPRRGWIGLQDHGSPCWFKNIRLKPLEERSNDVPTEDAP